MQQRIHDAFLNGIHTIFTTLFNDGVNDGVNLYRLSDGNANFYRESKVKVYKKPVLLPAKVVSSMHDREVAPEIAYHDRLEFTIPRKDMLDNEIGCSVEKDFDYLGKGFLEYHGDFYRVIRVQPKIYVEDAFMALAFLGERDVGVTELSVEPDPDPEPEPDEEGEDGEAENVR